MYRILVVEDSPPLRKLLSQAFAAEGHDCRLAGGVEEGFLRAQEDKPDLILLDVNLPDGNGIDLCRRLKENAVVRHIPVLLVTGEASSIDNKVSGFDAGADDYVLKPFRMKELLARVGSLLKSGVKPSGR
jgi:DNA-binding response OmpR family regulator